MISNKGIICKTINFHLNKWAIMNNFHCEWNWSLLCILLWLRRPRRSLCMSQDPITWSVIYVMYVQCHIYGQSHFKSCHLNQWWTWLAGLPPSSLPDELAQLFVLVTGMWVMCLLGQDRKSLSGPGCQDHLTDAGPELGMSEGQS